MIAIRCLLELQSFEHLAGVCLYKRTYSKVWTGKAKLLARTSALPYIGVFMGYLIVHMA
jgi:hypothetical protein